MFARVKSGTAGFKTAHMLILTQSLSFQPLLGLTMKTNALNSHVGMHTSHK